MATQEAGNVAPPTLVNNVETLANVPAIIANGAEWFRSVGTSESPGTVVCTVTGAVRRPSVIEVALGEPLRHVLDECRSGPEGSPMRPILAVLMGVSNAILTAADLDTPISYEDMKQLGSGLGSASFIVVEEGTDPLALAAGVSRFLAVESCGQCTACKQDGLEVFERLRSMLVHGGSESDLAVIERRLGTITDGARCNLAAQHQLVVGSIFDAFGDAIFAHLQPGHASTAPVLIAALASIEGETEAVDQAFLAKRADWTYGSEGSAPDTAGAVDDPGRTPVDRFSDHRSAAAPPSTP